MRMDAWDEVRSAVLAGEGACGAGASDDAVKAASQALGVEFPEELRCYLQRIGWIRVGGDTYYGLGDDLPYPTAMDLREMTRSEREDVEPPMQRHLVPILNNGFGDHWCVDTRTGAVVEWRHDDYDGEDQTPVFVDASFAAWLRSRVREVLEADQ